MEEEMDFDSLLGQEFDFYGVDNNLFKLNDTVWEAVEDEADGYRSMLDTVERKETDTIFFEQPVARVTLTYSDNANPESNSTDHLYRLVDVADGHVWLEFGTSNADDYYPSFCFYYTAKAPQVA